MIAREYLLGYNPRDEHDPSNLGFPRLARAISDRIGPFRFDPIGKNCSDYQRVEQLYSTGRNRSGDSVRSNAALAGLKNVKARAAIVVRIDRAILGNFGDCESVGDGVYEMRIHTGPGYRLCDIQRDKTVYVLLCGGHKGTQARDMKRAKKLALEV